MTEACEACSVVGVGPAAATRGSTTITFGSFRKFVVAGTDADVDGKTIGSPQMKTCLSPIFVAFWDGGGPPATRFKKPDVTRVPRFETAHEVRETREKSSFVAHKSAIKRHIP